MNNWKKANPRAKSWIYTCPKCDRDVYYCGPTCKYTYCPWCRAELAKLEFEDIFDPYKEG